MTTGAGFAAPIITWMYQGAVAASGSMYVYQTGTTTLVSIYSDAGLTTPLSNPLNLDSNGQAVFYVRGSVNLRLDGYTGLAGAGTLIKSIDPVYPVGTASGFTTEATLASATTTDLGTATSSLIDITGTTTITGFGSSASLTAPLYFLRFTGALTLTYDATKMILPGSANITTAAGDTCVSQYMGSGNWKVLSYSPISGNAVVTPTIPLYNNYITGFIPSAQNFSSNTSATMTISAGQAADSTNAALISGGSYSWSVANGNAANGYSGGTTIPNSSTIHFYICKGASGTCSFAIPHSSYPLTTGACPTGYNQYFRRVFSLNSNSSGVLLACCNSGAAIETAGGGLLYYLATQLLDVNVSNLGNSSRTLYTLTVPLDIRVQVLYRAMGSLTQSTILTSGDETDVAPSGSATVPAVPLFDTQELSAQDQNTVPRNFLTTNTSGQIGARCNSGTTNIFALVNSGFIDFRRN